MQVARYFYESCRKKVYTSISCYLARIEGGSESLCPEKTIRQLTPLGFEDQLLHRLAPGSKGLDTLFGDNLFDDF